jgi:dipeptidyl aminopeptidase/acylaminoacyl peptidase
MSPEGDRILVNSDDGTETGTPTISIFNVEDGTSTKLDLGLEGHFFATWRPNHDQLLLFMEPGLARRPAAEYYIVNADGSDLRPIAGERPDAGNPISVSSDGTKLAYEAWDPRIGRRVNVVDIDTGADRRVLDQLPRGLMGGGFSPDGEQLLLIRDAGEHMVELIIVPADGAGPVKAIGDPQACDQSSACLSVLWSPDGREILVTSLQDGNSERSWLFDVATGERRQLPWSAESMAWQRLAPPRIESEPSAEATSHTL